jgi:hypothetical protein
MNHRENGFALAEKRDGYRRPAMAGEKVVRPIMRINHPEMVPRTLRDPGLLAKPASRTEIQKTTPQHSFDL